MTTVRMYFYNESRLLMLRARRRAFFDRMGWRVLVAICIALDASMIVYGWPI